MGKGAVACIATAPCFPFLYAAPSLVKRVRDMTAVFLRL